jgi:hypothetical protein
MENDLSIIVMMEILKMAMAATINAKLNLDGLAQEEVLQVKVLA